MAVSWTVSAAHGVHKRELALLMEALVEALKASKNRLP